jgi:hypothetical protein
MKSKKHINKTRKKKIRRTKRKIGSGPSVSKLAELDLLDKYETVDPLESGHDTTFQEALADIDAEPTKDAVSTEHAEPPAVPTDDALEPTEDHAEIVLPKPIPVEYGVPLKEVMDRIQSRGADVKSPSYKALGPYVKFIYAYFIKKYESPCFLYNDQSFKHRAVLHYDITLKTLQFPANLGEQLRECIERGTEVIFITLYMKTSDNKMIKHVNLLIYRPFKKVIEHYEPHGPVMMADEIHNPVDLNDKLRDLFEVTLRRDLGNYTPKFKPASDLCPVIGFQRIEGETPGGRKNEDGYCQMWTMFLMETILLNPTQNTADILEECLDIGEKRPLYFKQLIRGYRQKIAQELTDYFSKYVKIPIGTQEAIDTMFAIDYNELIEEMKEETSKRRRPLPRLQDSYEYDMERFKPIHIAFYIHFLKTGTFKMPTTIGDKEELIALMREKQITIEMLSELMYTTYFEQLSKQEMNNVMYFSRYDEYLNLTLDLTYPPEKIEEAKEHIKKIFPFFHFFYFALEKAKTKKHIVDLDDVDNYDRWDIAELYFFMIHLRPATSEERKTSIFTSHNNAKTRETYVEKLFEFVKPYDISIGDLYLLWKLFKSE